MLRGLRPPYVPKRGDILEEGGDHTAADFGEVAMEAGEQEDGETERAALWVDSARGPGGGGWRARCCGLSAASVAAAVLLFLAGAGIGGLLGSMLAARRTGQRDVADVTGAHIWQMFRGGDTCPWTTLPEEDADCVHRRAVSQHIKDSLLRCGLPSVLGGSTTGHPEGRRMGAWGQPRNDSAHRVFARRDASLAHRGTPLLAPEHSLLGYELAAAMGAGFVECDVSVARDMSFVCRHSNCDLAITTDLLSGRHPHLAARCSVPFAPATPSAPAHARCCTYDFTLAELRTLCLTMEATPNASAATPESYAGPPPPWRSAALAGGPPQRCQRIVTFGEYLRWLRVGRLGAIPELKDTAEPGTRAFLASVGSGPLQLADAFVAQLRAAGFRQQLVWRPADRVWAWQSPRAPKAIMQTFDREVAAHWKSDAMGPTPPVAYLYGTAENASTCTPSDCGSPSVVSGLAEMGVELMAPPLWRLVTSSGHRLAPSTHAAFLNSMRVGIIAWSLDRSGCEGARPGEPAQAGPCGWYWTSLENVSAFEFSDIAALMYEMYHVANVTAAFSDYPAINTAFLNCVPRMM